MCQQDKVEQHQPRGLLKPLPIGEIVGATTYSGAILGERHYGLHHQPTKSEGYSSIIVMVDWFSKYATFIATLRIT